MSFHILARSWAHIYCRFLSDGTGKGRKKRGVAHIPTRRHSELRIYTGHRTLDHGKPGSHSPDRRRADHWHGVHRRRSYPCCQSKRAWNCDSSEPLGDRRDRHLRGSRRLRRSNRALSHDFPHPSPQCQSQTRRPREQTGLNCLHPERQQLSLPRFTATALGFSGSSVQARRHGRGERRSLAFY